MKKREREERGKARMKTRRKDRSGRRKKGGAKDGCCLLVATRQHYCWISYRQLSTSISDDIVVAYS